MALIYFTAGINSAHRVQRWAMQLWHVHQREQFFQGKGLYGTGVNNVIMEKRDFSKKAGFQMTEGLRMLFDSSGVVNDEILEDNEEAPDFHSMTWTISQLRNAGRYAGEETQQSIEYNLPEEIRDGLGDWMAEIRDEDIFTALAVAPSKIYFVNNRSGTATVVSTDLMTLADWVKAQTYAKTADPKLPPIKITGQKRSYRYIGIMHDHVSYDLKINDTNYISVVKDAEKRGKDNSLFNGSLIDYQGMILYDHDNTPIFTGWGSGSDVYGAESYLLGRQACIVGVGGYKIRGKNGFLKWVNDNGPLSQECELKNDVNSGDIPSYADDYEMRMAA